MNTAVKNCFSIIIATATVSGLAPMNPRPNHLTPMDPKFTDLSMIPKSNSSSSGSGGTRVLMDPKAHQVLMTPKAGGLSSTSPSYIDTPRRRLHEMTPRSNLTFVEPLATPITTTPLPHIRAAVGDRVSSFSVPYDATIESISSVRDGRFPNGHNLTDEQYAPYREGLSNAISGHIADSFPSSSEFQKIRANYVPSNTVSFCDTTPVSEIVYRKWEGSSARTRDVQRSVSIAVLDTLWDPRRMDSARKTLPRLTYAPNLFNMKPSRLPDCVLENNYAVNRSFLRSCFPSHYSFLYTSFPLLQQLNPYRFCDDPAPDDNSLCSDTSFEILLVDKELQGIRRVSSCPALLSARTFDYPAHGILYSVGPEEETTSWK